MAFYCNTTTLFTAHQHIFCYDFFADVFKADRGYLYRQTILLAHALNAVCHREGNDYLTGHLLVFSQVVYE
ncbi:hypothetical protein D3C86_1940870 [compost metagenome]